MAQGFLGLEPYDELRDAEENGDDTGGVPYHEVFGIERYKCPTAAGTTAEELEAECFGPIVDGAWTDLLEEPTPGSAPEAGGKAGGKATEATPLVGGEPLPFFGRVA